MHMLGLAKRVKARFLLTSTSEIYGDPKVHPQSEEYWGNVNPIGPRACYDEGTYVFCLFSVIFAETTHQGSLYGFITKAMQENAWPKPYPIRTRARTTWTCA